MSQPYSTFTRIGKGQSCFAYRPEYQDDFLAWHKTTKWFTDNEEIPADSANRRQIFWGKERNAIGWSNFEEGAQSRDGVPKLICKRCGTIVKHPNDGASTTGMDSHMKSKKCQKESSVRGLPKLTQMDGWRTAVLP